jgi:hypothetical protein
MKPGDSSLSVKTDQNFVCVSLPLSEREERHLPSECVNIYQSTCFTEKVN